MNDRPAQETGVKIVGGKEVEVKGTVVHGHQVKGVKIVDKSTPQQPVEVQIANDDETIS